MFDVCKGWVREKLTPFGMWLRLDENVYRRIDDSFAPSTISKHLSVLSQAGLVQSRSDGR